MDSEELLRRWAARKINDHNLTPERVTPEAIGKVEFRHEDGWTNDSGTSWPEENYAVVTLAGRRKQIQFNVFDLDGFDIPSLLADILASGSE